MQQCIPLVWGFPGGSVLKNLPANTGDARDTVSIPGLGQSPAGGNGNPLQYSCLENSTDRGAWRATDHEVSKSWTQRKRLNEHACTLFRTQGKQEGPIHPALELKGSPGGHRTGGVKRLKYSCIVETSVFAVVFSVTTGDTEV